MVSPSVSSPFAGRSEAVCDLCFLKVGFLCVSQNLRTMDVENGLVVLGCIKYNNMLMISLQEFFRSKLIAEFPVDQHS